MRVTTAFNKMLGIDGASVAEVTFCPAGIVVGLRRRRAKRRCPCGWKTWAIYDRSVRRWRHLDLGATRCFLEAEIARIDCARCGRVRTEEVPWARPGARHTKDFQDVVAWLAQRVDKTTITRLLRMSWEAVAKIVIDVVAEVIDDSRLDGLSRIGVDEISYRKGFRYLTVVADHDREGAVVWAVAGRRGEALEAFYDALGEARTAHLEAVSLDMGRIYAAVTRHRAPQATQCIDPFHVIALANEAVDHARRWAWTQQRGLGASPVGRRKFPSPHPKGRPRKDAPPRPRNENLWIKHTRWALLKDPDTLKQSQLDILHELRQNRSALYRSWQLKEGLRDLYRVRRSDAAEHLDWWLAWASRSRIPAFVKLAKTVRRYREGILAAIELGLSNSKLEGLNSKVRLINHRGYGHHSPAALIAMIYLCCGGVTIELPTERALPGLN